ncbi:protein-L-isoaspartate O-methyltransferase [Salinarchaeum chitinilyticum]
MGLFGSDSGPDGNFADQRDAMVDRLLEQGRISDPAVSDALRTVPRHEFVPENRRSEAYADRPLPIGDGQTISAPHMVGIMVELLDLDLDTAAGPNSESDEGIDVLEIGTGCGYHAAVTTAVLGDTGTVYSVEYSEQLADRACATFDRLGYDVRVRVGDGAEGWPANAPYEAAYLTCAAESLPEPIAEQTAPGGRIVAPIGTGSQTLYRYTKREDGGLDSERHGGVRFVQMR